MRLWFQRMASFLRADDTEVASVRAILRTAALRSASIGVGTLDGVALPSPLSGHVEDLEEGPAGALVISRPHDGPARRELVAGETLHLSIAADSGFHHGDVQVIGRWTAGLGAMKRYGYRVTVPKALVHEERRSLHRVPVAFDLAPRARLCRPTSLAEVGEGTVVDVSEGGLCLRVELTGLVRAEEQVVVRADFPAFFPVIHTEVAIAHIMPARKAGLSDVGLRFLEPQVELGRAIRQLELRRVNRAGAA
jgi:hypothetical protein